MRRCAVCFAGLLSGAHLQVVVLAALGGLQVEVGEVELDPVSLGDADVPHQPLVVGVRLGEARGAEAAVQPAQLHARRGVEEEGQDAHTAHADTENIGVCSRKKTNV